MPTTCRQALDVGHNFAVSLSLCSHHVQVQGSAKKRTYVSVQVISHPVPQKQKMKNMGSCQTISGKNTVHDNSGHRLEKAKSTCYPSCMNKIRNNKFLSKPFSLQAQYRRGKIPENLSHPVRTRTAITTSFSGNHPSYNFRATRQMSDSCSFFDEFLAYSFKHTHLQDGHNIDITRSSKNNEIHELNGGQVPRRSCTRKCP